MSDEKFSLVSADTMDSWERISRRRWMQFASAPVSAVVICACGKPQPGRSAGHRTISKPSRTLELAAGDMAGGELAESLLGMTLDAPDEPAEGPGSFDVRGQSLVVCDPLRRRLTQHDLESGQFRGALQLTGAPLTVEAAGGSGYQVTFRGSDEAVFLDAQGQVSSAGAERGLEAEPLKGQARLEGDRAGVITFDASRALDAKGPPSLQVELADPRRRIASLGFLGDDANRRLLVAVETDDAASRSLESVGKTVRVYDSAGRLVEEVSGLDLDYYYPPETEFRVRGNWLYQMVPRRWKVLIHVWDLA